MCFGIVIELHLLSLKVTVTACYNAQLLQYIHGVWIYYLVPK